MITRKLKQSSHFNKKFLLYIQVYCYENNVAMELLHHAKKIWERMLH